MAGRSGSVRAFFRWPAAALLGAAGSCAAGSEWSHPDAASQGFERASKWRSEGLPALAARQYEETARLARKQGDVALELHGLFDAAECWLLDGRPSVAAVVIEKAERSVRDLPPGSSRLRAAGFRLDCARGDLAAIAGRHEQARDFYERALGRALRFERDSATVRLALLAEREGDARRAAELRRRVADPGDPRLAELRRMLQPAGTPAAATTAAAAASRTPARTLSAPATAPSATEARALPILPRSSWGARRSRRNLDRMTNIWRVTVHHTATRLQDSSANAAAAAVRTFQRQHQDDKGWADIGYHFVVDPSGRIWEGRPLDWQGAHAGRTDLNAGNVGVALIGDFTVEQPTGAQKAALFDLLRSVCARYRIERSHVFTHQEIRPDRTDCPGPALQRLVTIWRRGATTAF